MLDVTENLQIIGQNADGSFNVRVSRPESTALAVPNQGYPVRINGTVVNFASAEDFRNAQLALGGGGGMPEVNTRRGGNGGFLRTATDAAETVNSAFEVRNANARRREYQDLQVAIADARQKVAAQTATQPSLVPPLLELFDAFGDAVALTIQNLEDDVTSGWVRTGIGAARTASDFVGRNGGGSDDGVGSALLAGGAVLGGGLLLAETLGRGPRRGFKRV